jgi:protoporphyrinogen/coproporphyrinogen III oxidase
MAPRSDSLRIAIIGGGITGLAAAHRIHEIAAQREMPIDVTVFEQSESVGGPLETIRRDSFVIETGADSFLSEKPWALGLAHRLGLASDVIGTDERFRRTLVVRKGRLVDIPAGFSLIAPAHLRPVLKSPLFSPLGKLRISIEPLIPKRRGEDGDESLSDFVTRRLGKEVLERIAQPLAGGIYTADPAQLSAAATMPRFVEMERKYGSLIRGLRAGARRNSEAKHTSGARWRLFVSFRSGIQQLVDAVVARKSQSIRRSTRVVAIEKAGADDAKPRPRWRLRLSDGSGLDADAILCAARAYDAAPLLAPHSEPLAAMLSCIDYASAATVNFAFRLGDFPVPPQSFGFVVPIVERRKIIAGSFSSLKFHGRAPEGTVLMRTFVGGALQSELMDLDDEAMTGAARSEIASLLGVTAPPIFTVVRRWPRSMPQFRVGHLDRVRDIESAARGIDGFALAGAFLGGVGIPDCIRSGEAAAERLLDSMNRA